MVARSNAWHMIAVLLGIALLLNWRRVPPVLLLVLLVGGGAYLLYRGWQGWTGHGGASGRVTYWRGRRVELDPPGRGRLAGADGGTLLSLAAGAALLVAAAFMLFR